MAVFVTPVITLLLVLFASNASAMSKESSLPPLPKPPILKKPEATAPRPRNVAKLKSIRQLRTKNAYAFGSTAAHSLEEAMALGFLKNEHPYKPGVTLVGDLKVGHCVIVPRSDERFSYGVVTEVLSPNMVCVACDKKTYNDAYTIKIIASSKLFLHPEWLNYSKKDDSTIASYTRSMKQTAPLSKTIEEESYERLPVMPTKNVAKK